MGYSQESQRQLYKTFDEHMESLIADPDTPIVRAGPAGREHYFRPHQLVVHEDDLDRALDLGLAKESWTPRPLGVDGVQKEATTPFEVLEGPIYDGEPLIELARATRALARERHENDLTLRLGVNHIVFGQPRFGCPAGPPEPAAEPCAPTGTAGSGVTIGVIDTSVWVDHPWLAGHVMALTPGAVDVPAPGARGPHAGHATFIAGVIRRIAPGARILVARGLDDDGMSDDATIASLIHEMARRNVPIINLSLGGYPDLEGGMVATRAALSEVSYRTAIVAAAGNKPDGLHLYPAAMKRVFGVGALDPAGQPTVFTNRGTWVDACAPGQDLVAAYYRHDSPIRFGSARKGRVFDGFAVWSGTSFAAPQLAAAIAVEMSRLGIGATQAAAHVLSTGVLVTGLGISFSPNLAAEPHLAL